MGKMRCAQYQSCHGATLMSEMVVWMISREPTTWFVGQKGELSNEIELQKNKNKSK